MTTPLAVPTIDIGGFLDGDADARRKVAAQVACVCRRTVFLIISGHRFPADLMARAKRELFAFFDLPAETKNRWHSTGPSKQRGHHGFATRGLANTLGQQTPPDLRETVFLGPVDDHRAWLRVNARRRHQLCTQSDSDRTSRHRRDLDGGVSRL